jgi:DUF1365 family protein
VTQCSVRFLPPNEVCSLYHGEVMHARMKPVAHRFAYRVYSLLIDLDALDAADRVSPFFSVGRFNLVGFDPRDHGPGDGSSPADHARNMLRRAGVEVSHGRVLLLCYPRILGFTFNPLAIFFVYDREDALRGVLYEVRNTFGQRHTYVAPVGDGELSAAGLRQRCGKLFYVSPFNGLEMHYLFRIRPPTEDVALRILERDEEGPILAATFIGARRALTTPSLLRAFFSVPLLTLKVVAGIHWEAFRLWRKGLRLVPQPKTPASGISFAEAASSPGSSVRTHHAEP